MYAQFFGNYLLSHGITKEQLMHAMQEANSEHPKLGTLAMHAGYMSASEVDRVIIMQTHEDKRFGELAIREGYLTEAQVTELLQTQNPNFLLLGQALLNDGVINNEQLQSLIIGYQSDNELYDADMSAETKDIVNHLVENFFVVAERQLSPGELSFLHLLFNDLVRFIGDDFSPVRPELCKEYPTNYCISQQINGKFSIRTYIDMPESTYIAFASRYVDEDFNSFDEYVQSSLEDFLNLHNGLFNVNMSNEQGLELQLDVPNVVTDELITFEHEAYLLPVVYSFGTIHFIFELIHNEL